MNQMLVFDSKLTRYDILYEIDEANVKFITIRRRSKKMIDEALAVPDSQWLKVQLENKLSELVDFFNINALSSPIMARIHFDLLWTVIADSLYHLFEDGQRMDK